MSLKFSRRVGLRTAFRSGMAALFGACTSGMAQQPAGYPGGYADTIAAAQRAGKFLIYAATDLPAANPLIRDFRALYPAVDIEYIEMNSVEVYSRFISESAAGGRSADVLWSPAMDLQMKLVNDGHAQVYASPEAPRLPAWAVWRNEAFGTTFEPVVFVYNKRLLAAQEVPQTHAALAKLLTENPVRFKGKVTTFNIERSGVGFLLATQDSKVSPAFWELARAAHSTGLNLQTSTSAMLERIASGENLLGYNLIGSYAIARAKIDPSIGYVLPKDYTLVMSRIVFIAKQARNPHAAKLWVDYLLSQRGQQVMAGPSTLFAIRADVQGEATAASLSKTLGNSLLPIVVGPGLLTYLDQAKRREFTKRWQGTEPRK